MVRCRFTMVAFVLTLTSSGAVATLYGQESFLVAPAEASIQMVDALPSRAPGVVQDGSSRLKWTLIGAGLGAATGLLVAGPVSPFADEGTEWEFAAGGAILGALAGFILSGPSPDDDAESQVDSFRLYLPAQGGFGIVYSP